MIQAKKAPGPSGPADGLRPAALLFCLYGAACNRRARPAANAVLPCSMHRCVGGVAGETGGLLLLGHACLFLCVLHRRPVDEPAFLLPLAGFCYAFLVCLCHTGSFSPDSFSYYEMSQTLFTDFGRVTTVRQYVLPGEYGISFPYFYPLLLAVTQAITQLGLSAGVWLNLLLTAAAGLLLLYLGKRLTGRYWPGCLAAFLLFTNASYLSEVYAARAIPAALLCALACWGLLAVTFLSGNGRQKPFRMRFFLVGLLAGCGMVLRFDDLALTGFLLGLALVLPAGGLRQRLQRFGCCLAGVLPPVLPWLCYSLYRFHQPWISDNMGTALRVETVLPVWVELPGTQAATLWTAPGLWAAALLHKARLVLGSLLQCSPAAIAVLALAAAAALFCRKRAGARWQKEETAFGVVLLYYAAKTLLYILVGYSDKRYHAETVILLAFAAAALLAVRSREKVKIVRGEGTTALVLPVLLAAVVLSGLCARPGLQQLAAQRAAAPLQTADVAPAGVSQLEEALRGCLQPEDRILFLGDEAYALGGWFGRRVYAPPKPAEWETIDYLLQEKIAPQYVLLCEKNAAYAGLSQALSAHLERVPGFSLEGYTLYFAPQVLTVCG